MTALNSSKKATVQKVLHRTACFFGGLVIAYCLLRIVITVHASFYDLEKFNFSHSLGYYLPSSESWLSFCCICFCAAEKKRVDRFLGGNGMPV